MSLKGWKYLCLSREKWLRSNVTSCCTMAWGLNFWSYVTYEKKQHKEVVAKKCNCIFGSLAPEWFLKLVLAYACSWPQWKFWMLKLLEIRTVSKCWCGNVISVVCFENRVCNLRSSLRFWFTRFEMPLCFQWETLFNHWWHRVSLQDALSCRDKVIIRKDNPFVSGLVTS